MFFGLEIFFGGLSDVAVFVEFFFDCGFGFFAEKAEDGEDGFEGDSDGFFVVFSLVVFGDYVED